MREEQEALHSEALQEHAAITTRLASQVLEALVAEEDLTRREAKVAWRLARWNLASQRRQQLGVCHPFYVCIHERSFMFQCAASLWLILYTR